MTKQPLTEQQQRILMSPISERRVKKRTQSGGSVSYVEAYDIKATLIRLFGYGGFDAEVIQSQIIDQRQVPSKNNKTNWKVSAQATVRLYIHQLDATYTETAIGGSSQPDITESLDMALKGLAVDTPIPTPSGWTTMGALKVNDLVFDMEGNVVRVAQKSEVKHLPCYRITFQNGEAITCDNEHYWWAYNGASTTLRVHNIETLYRRKKSGVSITIPTTSPLDTAKTDLPINPWTLGYWLGNGDSTSGRLTCHEDDLVAVSAAVDGTASAPQRKGGSKGVTFNVRAVPSLVESVEDRNASIRDSVDNERTRSETAVALGIAKSTVDRVLQGNPQDFRTGLTTLLRREGLLENKHIPDAYMRASYEQRLALLRGLMDSDGTASRRAQFTSTNRDLAADVAELVRTLGDHACVAEYDANGFGVTTRAYSVQWTPSVMPFTIPRKAEKTMLRKRRGGHRVKSIEKIDSLPTQCISVDSPTKSYLAGRDMVPTHNTAESDALKRCAIYLGTQFGLSLYDVGATHDIVRMVFSPGQEWSNGKRVNIQNTSEEEAAEQANVPKGITAKQRSDNEALVRRALNARKQKDAELDAQQEADVQADPSIEELDAEEYGGQR